MPGAGVLDPAALRLAVEPVPGGRGQCPGRRWQGAETGRVSREFWGLGHGSLENFWPKSTLLWRTSPVGRGFSREPLGKSTSDSSGLVTVLQRTRAVLRRSVSVKQERDAKRRSRSPQVMEEAGSARACALCIGDACGVRPKAAPGGRDGRICGIHDGGIDAGEPGGGEPPRRLSGGACRHCRATKCRAKCRRAPRERLHEWVGQCAGIGAVAGAFMRSMVRRPVTRKPRIAVRGRLHATAIGEAGAWRAKRCRERGAKRARG